MLLVPTVVAMSPTHGCGVFAAEPIAAGTPIATYVPGLDLRCTVEAVAALPDEMRTFFRIYAYSPPDEPGILYVSADNARFMNHSKAPNVDDSGPVAVALRDIAAGEELLTDYTVLCSLWEEA